MTKEEIEQKLVRARAAETTIKNEIIELLEQLVESKKPKRRHGDFGFSKKPKRWPRLTLQSFGDKFFSAGRLCCDIIQEEEQDYPDPVLVNAFDLLKEWSEDLEYFEFDVHHCEINTVEFSHAPIHIAGNWHTLIEAKEIWHKLGQLIATLKRQQAK